MSFHIMVFTRYMPRSGIAGSYVSSIFSFFFFFFLPRDCHTERSKSEKDNYHMTLLICGV